MDLQYSNEARFYKKTGPKRHPDVVDLDRELNPIQSAYIWANILRCKELKFQIRVNPIVRPVTADELKYCLMKNVFTVKIGRTFIDLIYEIRFPLSVSHFRLWIESKSGDSKTADIIDLRDTEMAVHQVKFANPFPLTNPYLSFCMSYTFNLRDFSRPSDVPPENDEFVTENMGPRLCVGMVEDKKRHEMNDDAFYNGTARPIEILPTVILDDGSIYDKNLVKIDVASMIY